MTNMEDIRKKSDIELTGMVQEARKTIREEHHKDKWSRKANIIQKAKVEAARALTELTARRRNSQTK